MSSVEPLLLSLAPYLMPVILAFLTVAVRSAFERMPSKQRTTLESVVNTAVFAVEQKTALGSYTSEQKKSLAMSFIHAANDQFGFKIPDTVIEPMLEEAVLVLNLARGKQVAAIKAPGPVTGGKA